MKGMALQFLQHFHKKMVYDCTFSFIKYTACRKSREQKTVMLCVLTLKTAIETKAALQLGQEWLGTFLTNLQHMTHLLGLTFFMVAEILTGK
jgi:hypothetical protein